jgi:disulfide bond formation protein DsbB
MKSLTLRHFWLALALVCAALVSGSLLLVAWLKLEPCPLCIFQRLLFMVLSLLAFIAFFGARRTIGRAVGMLALLTAISGAAVAGYQVWHSTSRRPCSPAAAAIPT